MSSRQALSLHLLGLALLLWSYRALLGLEAGLPVHQQVEQWFFESTGTSPGLVAGIAAWLAWRRLGRLEELPEPRNTRWPLGLFGLALALYTWATLTTANDLLAASLVALLLGVVAARAGAAGLRSMGLPVLVMVLALPIPSPLHNDIVWQLQLWSAANAGLLLNTLGLEVSRVGILLQHDETRFLVIESCSGLRSLRTLILASLVLRELFLSAGPRMWWLVAAAPPLALFLNVVRIAIIATDASLGEPELGEEHVSQGLLVLGVGSILLFVAGHFLAGREETGETAPRKRPAPLPWLRLLPPLVLMAALGTLLTPWKSPSPEHPELATFPMERAGWQGETLDSDRVFLGTLPAGNVVHRLYEYAGDGDNDMQVSLFIATEAPGQTRGSLASPKLLLPGRSWETGSVERVLLWPLVTEVDSASARNAQGHAQVYGWELRAEDAWTASLRSLLAMDRGPFERKRERVYVRLTTPSGEDADSRRRARHVLDRFVHDFRDLLVSL